MSIGSLYLGDQCITSKFLYAWGEQAQIRIPLKETELRDPQVFGENDKGLFLDLPLS